MSPFPNSMWLRLLKTLQSLAIVLDAVYLWIGTLPVPPQIQQQLTELCPSPSERIFMLAEVSTALLRELDDRTIHLTTLEILSGHRPGTNPCKYNNDRHATLHHLLSISDNLVHLRTLRIMALVEQMDIYHRGWCHASLQSYKPASAIAVWRCRNLRTLHIEIHEHKELWSEALHSRIVFGYISRVFPLLEELRVTVSVRCSASSSYNPTLCFELEGGMCLLGHLKQLRRLEVRRRASTMTPKYTREDLDWMVPTGQSDRSKKWRQHKVEQWRHGRVNGRNADEGLPLQQDQQHQLLATLGISNISAENALLARIRNLGLLEDVEEMVENMDADLCRPLSALEGLTFDNFSFQWPEKVLDEMFPNNRSFLSAFMLMFK